MLPATGCLFFSEKPRAYSTVTLRFAAPSDQAQADIPVSAPDAQDGLRIVKDVMASTGVAGSYPPVPVDQAAGVVLECRGVCQVALKDNMLAVSFVDLGRSRPSAWTKSRCSLLKEKLDSRFGAQNVTVSCY